MRVGIAELDRGGVHGADAKFIQKPFTIDELSSKVRDVLAKV